MILFPQDLLLLSVDSKRLHIKYEVMYNDSERKIHNNSFCTTMRQICVKIIITAFYVLQHQFGGKIFQIEPATCVFLKISLKKIKKCTAVYLRKCTNSFFVFFILSVTGQVG